ncbi:hypothetical protein [Candidatus Bodocaedibacter vickermanii]|uniref:Uncharacterized protein n=1 Tax=Candidatus Bodocaedibacter vickermanii TaxID=2741701 RepID=A0A7L9RUH0_9PROT|nr:hypothetical protein CPBP_01007 [Candidatus Paracaedibacteraceae bacterium 'Lake Konstanz']
MLKIALILCLGLAPNVSASIATAVAGVRVAQTARGLLVENVTSWRERDPYSGVIQNSGITATDTSRMNAINRILANSAHISRESHDAPIEAQLREARFWEEQTEQLAAANRLRALLRNLDPAQIPLELRHYFQTGQSAVSSNSNQETASSPPTQSK